MSVVFSFAFDLFSHPNSTPLKEKLSREKCHEGKGETFFLLGGPVCALNILQIRGFPVGNSGNFFQEEVSRHSLVLHI